MSLEMPQKLQYAVHFSLYFLSVDQILSIEYLVCIHASMSCIVLDFHTGSPVHFRSGSVFKTVLDKDIETTVHKQEVICRTTI